MIPEAAIGAYLKAHFRPDNAADLLAAAQPLMAIAWDEAIDRVDEEGLLMIFQTTYLKSVNPYRKEGGDK